VRHFARTDVPIGSRRMAAEPPRDDTGFDPPPQHLNLSREVARHKCFAQQNLGAGRIHFARVCQIALGGGAGQRPAQPKNKDTLPRVLIFEFVSLF